MRLVRDVRIRLWNMKNNFYPLISKTHISLKTVRSNFKNFPKLIFMQMIKMQMSQYCISIKNSCPVI